MTDRLAYINEAGVAINVILADPSFDPNGIPCNAPVSVGYIYANGIFYPPQPFPSWTMAENSPEWLPPVAKPEEGIWNWDEETLSWVEVVQETPAGS